MTTTEKPAAIQKWAQDPEGLTPFTLGNLKQNLPLVFPRDPENSVMECDYLSPDYKHGYTVMVGRAHADGTVRLAREVAYGSPTWKARYSRRNSAESRNSVLQRLGLKRMPVHGLPSCHVTVLQGDFVANQRTLVRLMREAAALSLSAPSQPEP